MPIISQILCLTLGQTTSTIQAMWPLAILFIAVGWLATGMTVVSMLMRSPVCNQLFYACVAIAAGAFNFFFCLIGHDCEWLATMEAFITSGIFGILAITPLLLGVIALVCIIWGLKRGRESILSEKVEHGE